MPIPFDDIQFPNDIAQNALGGPVYSTTLVTAASGYEQGNSNWDQPRHHWDVAHDITSAAKLLALQAFFHARRGRGRAFRFQDWSDYTVGMDASSGTLTYTGFMQFATGDGSTTVFQITKTYSDTANPFVRKITRPQAGTVRIYFGGAQQTSGFTVDYTTGKVTFSVAPPNATVIQWAGKFDVPARFDTDAMRINLETIKLGMWQSVPIVEIRE